MAAAQVCADPAWDDCTLTVHGSGQTVTLTPSYQASGSGWIYTYVLHDTASVEIQGFTLTLPTAVPVSSCTGVACPDQWQLNIRTSFNQLDWSDVSHTHNILPGGSGTFQFSTAYGPSSSKTAQASSQDALGFAGPAYSPIPEPASLAALLMGIGVLAGLRKRRAI